MSPAITQQFGISFASTTAFQYTVTEQSYETIVAEQMNSECNAVLNSLVLCCMEAGCGIICDDLNSNSDENGSLPQKSEYTSALHCMCVWVCVCMRVEHSVMVI